MPTYLYQREDGSKFEIEQRITAPKLTECPTTGQPVKRLISPGAGLVFKGTGFYLTDYARKDNGRESSSSPDRDSEKTGTATSSDATGDSSTTSSGTKEPGTGSTDKKAAVKKKS
jgi:putative FmdB family regulatory protein